MRNEVLGSVGWPRALALAAVVALGLVAIVGSGGGGSIEGGECSFFTNSCVPVIGPTADAFVFPSRMTAQVGGTATFTATTTAAHPAYQWKRSADSGSNYVDIPGATGASFTLTSLRLTDDAAVFTVDVSSGNTLVFPPAPARLAVSSMPSVVFQDAEFLPADWATSSIASPAQNGPTNSEERATTGGNPDAFRRMTYTLTAGPSSLRVFNASQASSYDPSSQGAIYTIDFTEDCIVASSSPSIGSVDSKLLIQQGARKYTTGPTIACSTPAWLHVATWPSLSVANFVLVDGPACGAGESCPDFSASGAPLQFGYIRDARQAASAPAASIVHGIDNWKVTVWRR